jgi:type 1 fimbria pilin
MSFDVHAKPIIFKPEDPVGTVLFDQTWTLPGRSLAQCNFSITPAASAWIWLRLGKNSGTAVPGRPGFFYVQGTGNALAEGWTWSGSGLYLKSFSIGWNGCRNSGLCGTASGWGWTYFLTQPASFNFGGGTLRYQVIKTAATAASGAQPPSLTVFACGLGNQHINGHELAAPPLPWLNLNRGCEGGSGGTPIPIDWRAPVCSVTTADLVFPLGDIDAEMLDSPGKTTTPSAPQNIMLNCTGGPSVRMAITGNAVPSTDEVFGLTGGATATNVGVQLFINGDTSTPVVRGRSYNIPSSTDTVSIPVQARYYALGTAGIGDANANMTVTFTIE